VAYPSLSTLTALPRRAALSVRWSTRRLQAERDGAREALAALIDGA
jgi:hypothetical protein